MSFCEASTDQPASFSNRNKRYGLRSKPLLFCAFLIMVACVFLIATQVSDSSDANIGDEFEIDDLKYIVLTESGDTGTVSVQAGTSFTTAALVIPDTVQHSEITYSVTTLPNSAFKNKTCITSISFGSNVEDLGQYSFQGCTGLTEVTLPSKGYVRAYAFDSCPNITT